MENNVTLPSLLKGSEYQSNDPDQYRTLNLLGQAIAIVVRSGEIKASKLQRETWFNLWEAERKKDDQYHKKLSQFMYQHDPANRSPLGTGPENPTNTWIRDWLYDSLFTSPNWNRLYDLISICLYLTKPSQRHHCEWWVNLKDICQRSETTTNSSFDPIIEIQRFSEKYQTKIEKPEETEQKAEGSKIMITASTSKENWEAIKNEYGMSKRDFGKKINFVLDPFKREIIFRDVEHAFVLASQGFSKPALILAGGVIEELLRLYLECKRIKPKSERFVAYIQACEDNKLLKRGVFRLTDSIRDFRNLVHLKNEETKRHTVSQATAKGAVSSIFTIANDFQ